MINYPTKPQTLFTIEEIAAQIQSGEYSAELSLMHLCHRYDELENLAKEIFPVFIEAANDAMSFGPLEGVDSIYKEKQEKAQTFLNK